MNKCSRVFLALLATSFVAEMPFVGLAEASRREPKISVFSYFIVNVAKERGTTLAEAAERLYDLGVRGFDASVFDRRLAELSATRIKPINLYYFPAFAGENGGLEENAKALDIAVKYGVPRMMTIPPGFAKGGDEEGEFVRNTRHLKSFVAQAKARGVTVTIEDFGGTNNACSHVKCGNFKTLGNGHRAAKSGRA